MKVILLTEHAAPELFAAADCVIVRTVAELENHRDADLLIDLDFTRDEARLAALCRMLPAPVIVNEVVQTVGEIGCPFVRINAWPGMLERTVHELVVPDEVVARQVKHAYEKLGHAFRSAPDIPGMVTARILAMLINEAWYTWEEGVSGKEEIDTAMKLGTNYPMGPFEWGVRIGLDRIVGLLEVMAKTDPRYAPAKSLKKAGGGVNEAPANAGGIKI
jgi:3-hydroxybutyryl-CoA dehydrogenase